MKMKIVNYKLDMLCNPNYIININNFINYSLSNISMHNHQHNLKTHNMSKLLVIGLSIILITGISLVPALQIGVQGQVQHQQSPPSPPSPGGSPSSGTSPPPASSAAPPSPGGSPSSGTSPPPPALDATGGGAANQTEDGAVNQSAMVMIPQSSMEMMMSNVQNAMTAMDNGNTEDAMIALESLDQELKSAANASGISVETITDE
jgi:hypothetical protein